MKKLFTESEVINLFKSGTRTLTLSKGDLLTPLAKDKAKALGITISKASTSDSVKQVPVPSECKQKNNSVAIGSDHTGFQMKKIVINVLTEKGFCVDDCGTHNEESCDYPDFALAVATKVKQNKVDFGIIIDATGIPSAIAANKLKGIRAATCYNEFSAKSAREHNNANVLVVGAKSLGEETIKSILETWLKTDFAGGRHQKRLDKITAIENNN